MVVCAAMLMAVGPAATQPPPPSGPFNILHKDGAIYNSTAGWNMATPPYYAGKAWAVDFTYTCEGVSILHQDGAIWNATAGWNMATPPYYAGSGYARAVEYVRDLTGCWGLEWFQWETVIDQDETNYDLEKQYIYYPFIHAQVTQQIGTRLFGQAVVYEQSGPYGPECQYLPFEGTVIGDHVTIFVGEYGYAVPVEGSQYDLERIKLTLVGLVFWDDEDAEWEIRGSFVGTELPPPGSLEPTCTENGRWGSFNMWPEEVCDCPPLL